MRELTDAFIPATDECWRLQTSDDRQARAFRTIIDGSPDPVRGSRQGTYILTPGGRLLARGNSTDPRAIERILVGGLAAWNALSPAEQSHPVPDDLIPESRFEDAFPEDGLVLEQVVSDLPGGDPGRRGAGWNLDHVWISAQEVAEWWFDLGPTMVAPREVTAPAAVVDRLVRFHLVDNARGQEAPFAPEEVEEAILTARVAGSDGRRVRIALSGRTSAATDGTWKLGENLWKQFNRHERPRGVTTRLAGYAIYDRPTGRFETFRLVAIGETWGGSGLNGRPAAKEGEEPQRAPVAWRFVEAGTRGVDRVPPAFIDLYGGRWVE